MPDGKVLKRTRWLEMLIGVGNIGINCCVF